MMRIKPTPFQTCAIVFAGMYLFMLYSGWSLQRKVHLLGSRDATIRGRARRDLMALGTRATSLIVMALGDTNAAVRRESASLLGTMGDDRVISALRRCLKDPSTDVRRAAKIALIHLKDSTLIPQLVEDILSKDRTVRTDALTGLSSLRSKAAVEALVRAFEKEQTRSPSEGYQITAAQGDVGTTLACMGKVAVDTVVQHFTSQLRGGDEKGNYVALLQRMGPEIIPKLLPLLKDRDLKVRTMAAMALTNQAKDPKVQQALLGIMKDDGEPDQLRVICLDSLTAGGAPEAGQMAMSYLSDRKAPIKLRTAAVAALRKAKSPEANAALRTACTDKEPGVRVKALEVIASTHHVEDIPLLVKAFSDPNEAVRKAASQGLSSLTTRALPTLAKLAKSSDPEVRKRVPEILGNTRDTDEFPIRYQLLSDNNMEVVRAAVSSIPERQGARYRSALSRVATAETNPPDVRLAALRKLYALDSGRAESVRRVLSKSKNQTIIAGLPPAPSRPLPNEPRVVDGQVSGSPSPTEQSYGTSDRCRLLSASGEKLTMDDQVQKGKLNLILFTALWSRPGKRLADQLWTLSQQRKDVFVGIVDIHSWHSPVGEQYHIRSLPQVWIFDRRGRLVSKERTTLEQIKEVIAKQ